MSHAETWYNMKIGIWYLVSLNLNKAEHKVHLWVTQIRTHKYFNSEMPYLDLCGFQPPGDLEPQVKNSQVLKYSWVHRYLEVLMSTQDNKVDY